MSLKKHLARHGFGKGSLLMALVLFGKLTAPSKAAATQITVTAAATKVGVAASVAAIASGKTAIISLTTAGILAVSTLVATSEYENSAITSGKIRQKIHTSYPKRFRQKRTLMNIGIITHLKQAAP